MPLSRAQLDAAIVATRTILPLAFPADTILRRFFQENPMYGVQDRAFIAETVFGILRHRFLLESLIERITRALVLAYLAKFHGINLRELTSLISKTEATWLSEVKAFKPGTLPLFVQAEFPGWLGIRDRTHRVRTRLLSGRHTAPVCLLYDCTAHS